VLNRLPYACVCGGSGCLEQYASGRGLAERAVAAARDGRAPDLLSASGATAEELSATHVVAAARQGIASAVELIDDAADAVARALAAVSVTTELERAYLAGSLGHAASDLLLHRIEASLASRWPFASSVPPPPVVLDQVGPHAAAVGAALLARDEAMTPT
jgi:glucokinase